MPIESVSDDLARRMSSDAFLPERETGEAREPRSVTGLRMHATGVLPLACGKGPRFSGELIAKRRQWSRATLCRAPLVRKPLTLSNQPRLRRSGPPQRRALATLVLAPWDAEYGVLMGVLQRSDFKWLHTPSKSSSTMLSRGDYS